jgi:hypothetical protein
VAGQDADRYSAGELATSTLPAAEPAAIKRLAALFPPVTPNLWLRF